MSRLAPRPLRLPLRLPFQPDFVQLKHQAKDLLRAHERKEASVFVAYGGSAPSVGVPSGGEVSAGGAGGGEVSVCEVLRNLRRFASADDAAIFGKPLALHEAQYALAMAYGFASWNALKRYVEHVTGRPMAVRREKDRTYVAGLEGHSVGWKDSHEDSFIACITGVMAALGEEFSYPYLMGVSGAAFRVQMHQPNWCPSAACAGPGYNCIPGAMAATGYRLTEIDTQREGKPLPEGIAKAFETVTSSIDRGLPVILFGGEAGLIVGYHADGRRIVRPYGHDDDGYVETAAAGAEPAASELPRAVYVGDWGWGVYVVEPHDVPMDRRTAVTNSLRLAVTLAKTERFGNYLSGFAALEHWIEALLDDSRFAALTPENWFQTALGNGYSYPCLWSARLNAEKYLREAADLTTAGETPASRYVFDEPIRTRLLELAGLYEQMHLTLNRTAPEFACTYSLMPWRLQSPINWTRTLRQKQSNLLREMCDIEHKAIAKIESLLGLMDASTTKGLHNG